MKNDITTVDAFAARLRETEPTIANGDFTAAVMTQLPRLNELSIWKKNAILLAATALGSVIVAWQDPLTVVPELLIAAATNGPALLGTAVVLAYSAAIAAVWTARKF